MRRSSASESIAPSSGSLRRQRPPRVSQLKFHLRTSERCQHSSLSSSSRLRRRSYQVHMHPGLNYKWLFEEASNKQRAIKEQREKKRTTRLVLPESFVLLGRRLNNVLIRRWVISMVSKCVWRGNCFNIMMWLLVSLQVIMDRSKILLHLLFAPCMAASLHVCADIAKGGTHVCASILVRTLVDIHTVFPQLNTDQNYQNPRLTFKALVCLKLTSS